MAEVYNRGPGGRVVWLEMTRLEVETAVKRAPWAWSTELRGFAPWPADRVRGDPVIPASLADTVGTTRTSSLWERT